MSENNNLDNADLVDSGQPIRKPDESSGLLIEAKFKISDPESGEVIVEGRS